MLELVTDRGERDDLARSGLRLRSADRVLTQFGKALRGRLRRRASNAIEPLRPLIAGKLGDIEFEGGSSRGGPVVADPDQLAASAKQSDGGLMRGNVIG